jgi:hypothetical protein
VPVLERYWQTHQLTVRTLLLGMLLTAVHGCPAHPGEARPPGALRRIDSALRQDGFEITLALDGYGYRYERGGVLVDVHADPATQREDLLRLLSMIEDPRAIWAELRKSERQWLRAAEDRLNLAAPSLLGPDDMLRAQFAHRLLVAAL